MPDTQESAFLPGPPNELHTHRETCARKTTGHGEGREAGEAHRARQAAHISLWRGAANGVRSIGGGGCDNGIHLGQRCQEFSRDHLSETLRSDTLLSGETSRTRDLVEKGVRVVVRPGKKVGTVKGK